MSDQASPNCLPACPYCHRTGCEGTGILDPATRTVRVLCTRESVPLMPPRVWDDTEHESTTTMGPIEIRVAQWRSRSEWGFSAAMVSYRVRIAHGHDVGHGVTRDEAKVAAVAAVEAWRDSIR